MKSLRGLRIHTRYRGSKPSLPARGENWRDSGKNTQLLVRMIRHSVSVIMAETAFIWLTVIMDVMITFGLGAEIGVPRGFYRRGCARARRAKSIRGSERSSERERDCDDEPKDGLIGLNCHENSMARWDVNVIWKMLERRAQPLPERQGVRYPRPAMTSARHIISTGLLATAFQRSLK